MARKVVIVLDLLALLAVLVYGGGCGVFDRPCQKGSELLFRPAAYFPEAIPPVLTRVTREDFSHSETEVVVEALGDQVCLPSPVPGIYHFSITELAGFGHEITFIIAVD